MNKNTNCEELERVNGGTVGELADLAVAFLGSNAFSNGSAHAPVVNEALAYEIRRKLRQLGIRAVTHTGIAGTGIFSSPNEYTNIATGESMTHMEVVALLQAKG